MKRYFYAIVLLASFQMSGQYGDFRNYLALGVEGAEDFASIYLNPLSEGLMYGLTGGYYNTAKVKEPWKVSLALVSNGSFVPKDKLSREIDISDIDNLRVLGGGNIIKIPTILGETKSNVTLIATLNGEDFEFDAPTGIGLVNINLLPNAFLQGSVGLPANSEFVFRYFPKLNIDEASVGITGVGLKHEISQTIQSLQTAPVALMAMVAYTRLNAEYDIFTEGFVTGTGQRVDGYLNTWMFELVASTKNPIYNFYTGLGYITGNSNYALLGTYEITAGGQVVSFTNPFDVQADISGIRFGAGANVRMGWFSMNLDYTFQGYNNISLGLNFDIYSPSPRL